MINIGYGELRFNVKPSKIIGVREGSMNHVEVYLVGMPNYKVIAKPDGESQRDYCNRITAIANGDG